MKKRINSKSKAHNIEAIDAELSNRFIALDPLGYFIIKVNQEEREILVEHYTNDIDNSGRATDPDTGEPLQCRNGKTRLPTRVYKGRSAKEVGIKLSEAQEKPPISSIDHALYLGRELQKAEFCLLQETAYIQD